MKSFIITACLLMLTACNCPRVVQSVQTRQVSAPVAAYRLEFGLPRLKPADTLTRFDTLYIPRLTRQDCVRVVRVTERDTVRIAVDVPADTVQVECPEYTQTVIPGRSKVADILLCLPLLLLVALLFYVTYSTFRHLQN